MLVLKFGGTSMGSAESIKQVAEIVKDKTKNSSVILVVILSDPEQNFFHGMPILMP